MKGNELHGGAVYGSPQTSTHHGGLWGGDAETLRHDASVVGGARTVPQELAIV